ncbi:hypothetical protein EDB89DRAFT_1913422 [Lactarius sanguifluus]|nr:hypothetical protein EDB89DRAFT_1913422 [Lactarius sanguifluus]
MRVIYYTNMRSTRLLLSQWRYGGLSASFRVGEVTKTGFCNGHYEVEALVAPHASSVDAVHEWLESHGIQKEACHRFPAGDWVTVRLPFARRGEHGTRSALIQQTTAFNRAKGQRTFRFSPAHNVAPPLSSDKKILRGRVRSDRRRKLQHDDHSFVSHVALQRGRFHPSGRRYTIAITAYSEQFSNFADFQAFYEEQVPQALNRWKTTLHPRCSHSNTQQRTLFRSNRSPPTARLIPDDGFLAEENVPLVISTSYGDDEQIGVLQFGRPNWHNRAVQSFLESLPKGTYAVLFNPARRNAYGPPGPPLPDRVLNQRRNLLSSSTGQPVLIGGSSAAAPSFVTFVPLLNDVRPTHGRPSLGFLNPLLYRLNGERFNNITTGNTPGCGMPGFNATAGYPVAGFGTANVEKLRQIVE